MSTYRLTINPKGTDMPAPQVVDRTVTATTPYEAVKAMKEVPGVVFIRRAKDNGDGTFTVTIDLV